MTTAQYVTKTELEEILDKRFKESEERMKKFILEAIEHAIAELAYMVKLEFDRVHERIDSVEEKLEAVKESLSLDISTLSNRLYKVEEEQKYFSTRFDRFITNQTKFNETLEDFVLRTHGRTFKLERRVKALEAKK